MVGFRAAAPSARLPASQMMSKKLPARYVPANCCSPYRVWAVKMAKRLPASRKNEAVRRLPPMISRTATVSRARSITGYASRAILGRMPVLLRANGKIM